jgi:hypothetical protein
MNITQKGLFALLLVGFVGFMSSCGDSDVKGGSSEVVVDDGAKESSRSENIKLILHTVPTPMSTASLIKEAGADFNAALLSSTENTGRFNSAVKQSLALGVFGADLSYSSMFDKEAEAIVYLSATQKMCADLGIEGALDNDVFARMNANKENRDSVLVIVSDTYYSMDLYLKDIGREDLLSLIIAGGWIEGLYLAGNHYKGNSALADRIAEQKFSAKSLINLIDSYSNAPHLKDTRDKIAEINKLFDKITVEQAPTTTTKDASGNTIVNGGGTFKYTNSDVDAIVAAVNALRSEIVK